MGKRECPEKCNVLLIGSGGREHALAWKMSQSDRLGKFYATDCSNGGIAKLAEPCNEAWDANRAFFLRRWCDQHSIDLVVVGPEVPLAEGIVDELSTDTRLVFGPCKEAAQVESDKSFAKELMRQASIPTADARSFSDIESAKRYVLRGLDREFESERKEELAAEINKFMDEVQTETAGGTEVFSSELQSILSQREEPCVVKASGLAAGKGVILCRTIGETLEAIDLIMQDKAFGDAGNTLLIEEMMTGQEVSVLALVDGETIWVLDLCQDHKQVGEGDVGPNTGGMGAFCPAPLLDEEMMGYVEKEILVPTIDAMRRNGVTYRGVLYAGLMLTPAGPKVLEFNCRFGDPETQPLMARLEGDLVDILWRTAAGTLDGASISFNDVTACCVVMCSEGYPCSYTKGKSISGIETVENNNLIVFHAGTKVTDDGIMTAGGRVLGVTAIANSLEEAKKQATDACSSIQFEGAFWRKDIGNRLQPEVT